ncbi:MAG: FlgD immunoglobulin-like domain containing protein, partial [Pseudomonadota bacterium]
AEMPAVFDGAPIRVQATPPDGADWMELIVTDVAGNVVQRQPLPLSDATFSWTGETPQGDAVPPGIYQLSVQSWSGETLLGTQNANVRATIEEAQLLNGEVVLTMAGGVRVPADEILRISRGTGE